MIYADKMKRAKYLLDNDEDFVMRILKSIACDVDDSKSLLTSKNSENEILINISERAVAHRNGEITGVELVEAAHAASIIARNQYMRRDNGEEVRQYTQKDYDTYKLYCPDLKESVRDLVTEILGYAPELKYSLRPELMIRAVCDEVRRRDPSVDPLRFTDIHRQSAARIQYREAYFKGGWELADQLPLLNFSEENVLRWLNPKPTKAEFQSCK